MKIGIVGYGYVGTAIAGVFAKKGHDVLINDIKPLPDMVKKHQATKERMMEECQVVFICVDTPQRDNGGCDLSKVYEVFNDLHRAWGELSLKGEGLRVTQKQPIIAIKSTVIPGTLDTLKAAYPWCCSNPEFLRQDSPYTDFLNPDRIVIGADKPEVIETMTKLYEGFQTSEGFDTPILVMKPTEAELTKYLANTLLLTKVAFSQEINRISTLLGIDAMKVYRGIIADSRIDFHHLDPSKGTIPLDSACLPKDVSALIQQLDMSGYDTNFLKTSYAKAVHGIFLDFKLEVVQ